MSTPAPVAARRPRLVVLAVVLGAPFLAAGCTPWREYIHNGFKVGPNYGRPPAPVAKEWIDANDVRVRSQTGDLSKWWTVFSDPVLDQLVCFAYQQNLSLRAAAFRVLEARAVLAIDVGNLLPQRQQATADYIREAVSTETGGPRSAASAAGIKRFFSQWDFGFNLSWELDFWGRLRRAVEADAALLDASVENYDDVLVTLLGDVATNYINYRTTEQRIKYAEANVKLQTDILKIAEARFAAKVVQEIDVVQARSTVEQTQATIPELQIALRQSANQLCILLGIPPEELSAKLGKAPIPAAPVEVIAGIPADLLRRRPDVRRAERQAAAQSAEIGIAEAEFYPHIAINGTLGWSAAEFKDLFRSQAFNGTIGPSFTWNILNYGRILSNVRLQDAKFQELVATYQNTVLAAQQEVENGMVTFLRAQERTKLQAAAVTDAEKAVTIALAQYKSGTIDFTRVTQLEQNLVPLQDTLAIAEGEIATGLAQVYKALGGGWQIRCMGCDAHAPPGNSAPGGAEEQQSPPVPPPGGAALGRPEYLPDPQPVTRGAAPAPRPLSASEARAARYGIPVNR
jgi:NodT family efflux transporter outer membrane factor (OMF) lipoprotein